MAITVTGEPMNGTSGGGGARPAPRTLPGAASGVVATVAMSAWMFAAQRLGWEGEQPPERIVEAGLDAADIDRAERTENALASVAHLAFGASHGILYAHLLPRVGRVVPGALAGPLYGLAVWSSNYQTWIPWLGILPPPRHDRPHRPLTMILAHLIYGAVLGTLVDRRARRAGAGFTRPPESGPAAAAARTARDPGAAG